MGFGKQRNNGTDTLAGRSVEWHWMMFMFGTYRMRSGDSEMPADQREGWWKPGYYYSPMIVVTTGFAEAECIPWTV